ncbi:phosphonate C-P lyase system protein PhnG [Labrys sp. 22185]|uniref:phosphonate C-P lyase system protein PhnG n=1 Tax=Labrys sp. 22185 TaxID=3453888 RepID=UPI003F87D915
MNESSPDRHRQTAAEPAAGLKARQAVMRLCAHATGAELDQALSTLAPLPAHAALRPALTGLVMLQGRVGGDGAAFNLGEASTSRATVRLENGPVGFAYHLGRNSAKASAAALLDALWQDEAHREAVERALRPVATRLNAEAGVSARQTAATRVNFFTMVRGED